MKHFKGLKKLSARDLSNIRGGANPFPDVDDAETYPPPPPQP